LIVTSCVIVAAKLEQPMTPSISRMIKLLSDEEKNFVDKEGVIRKEGEIINTFNFDFNYISPLAFLERFMRIAEHHKESSQYLLSIEILKLAAT
jgi:hypothetical protein